MKIVPGVSSQSRPTATARTASRKEPTSVAPSSNNDSWISRKSTTSPSYHSERKGPPSRRLAADSGGRTVSKKTRSSAILIFSSTTSYPTTTAAKNESHVHITKFSKTITKDSLSSRNLLIQYNHPRSQDDCKVYSRPLMVGLSNHRQLEQASFGKLRMSRHQWAASLCNRPANPWVLVAVRRDSSILWMACCGALSSRVRAPPPAVPWAGRVVFSAPLPSFGGKGGRHFLMFRPTSGPTLLVQPWQAAVSKI